MYSYIYLFFFKGYERIFQELSERTRGQRHVLNHYCVKIKKVLQATQAICPQKKADFLAGAETFNEDLENRKYTILIAGKDLHYLYTVKNNLVDLISPLRELSLERVLKTKLNTVFSNVQLELPTNKAQYHILKSHALMRILSTHPKPRITFY